MYTNTHGSYNVHFKYYLLGDILHVWLDWFGVVFETGFFWVALAGCFFFNLPNKIVCASEVSTLVTSLLYAHIILCVSKTMT